MRIERIVSTGEASPPGVSYDQEWSEWVVVLMGSARLLIDGEVEPRLIQPGDFVNITAYERPVSKGPIRHCHVVMTCEATSNMVTRAD